MSNRVIIREISSDDEPLTDRVYVIGGTAFGTKFFKIGRSAYPGSRVSDFQTGNPFELSLLFETARLEFSRAKWLEGQLKRYFHPFRGATRETFIGITLEEITAFIIKALAQVDSKHPWSSEELMCAVCGEYKYPAELDQDFTCSECLGIRADDVPVMDRSRPDW